MLAAATHLSGVLHVSGAGEKGLIAGLTSQRVERMHGAKAFGAWFLQCAALRVPIETYSLFSSVASALGNVGQANYAAGNACLDTQALARRQHGLVACSLQWPLIGVGMGAAGFNATDERHATVTVSGLSSISLEEYTTSLAAQFAAGAGIALSVQLMHHADDLVEDLADASQPRFIELVRETGPAKLDPAVHLHSCTPSTYLFTPFEAHTLFPNGVNGRW